MEETLRVFYRVITDYTDITWGKTRDDLISKVIKILRAYKEGKSKEEVLKDRNLSFEVEQSVDYLYTFYQERPEDTDKLMELLSHFIKSPAPCKMKIIKLMEVLIEDKRSIK